jgi:hypothetical protein
MNRILVRNLLVGALALLALTLTSLGVAAGSSSARVDGHSAAASGTSAASGRCSKATALEVATRFRLADPTLPEGIGQIAKVFCGAFLGPGSQAMVVAFTPGTCGING